MATYGMKLYRIIFQFQAAKWAWSPAKDVKNFLTIDLKSFPQPRQRESVREWESNRIELLYTNSLKSVGKVEWI